MFLHRWFEKSGALRLLPGIIAWGDSLAFAYLDAARHTSNPITMNHDPPNIIGIHLAGSAPKNSVRRSGPRGARVSPEIRLISTTKAARSGNKSRDRTFNAAFTAPNTTKQRQRPTTGIEKKEHPGSEMSRRVISREQGRNGDKQERLRRSQPTDSMIDQIEFVADLDFDQMAYLEQMLTTIFVCAHFGRCWHCGSPVARFQSFSMLP
ncbi:hypothetical protein [Propionivibrio sp.]|uniref:hypothetical protein n=1 Tax=Propionivibrio sp. TaxID=2212460 RepID=UPI0025DF14E7|nr:hypothetical protein [Propionivibrio sp.]MBK7357597.1 hypothetical protein [Propionivibrio sp.]